MSTARDLADRFHQRWLEANPFAASMYGLPGYDDLVPDDSEEGAQAWRAEVARFTREADAIAPGSADPGRCRHAGLHEGGGRAGTRDHRHGAGGVHGHRHAVRGAGAVLALAARTVLVDQAAAEAYLTRLRRSGAWLDQIGERLRAGAGQGAVPGRPAHRAGHRLGRGCPGRPRPGTAAGPAAAGGVGPGRGLGVRTAFGRRGGSQAGVGALGDHAPRAAAKRAAVRAGRAGLPARRRGRLRPGGPDLYDPAAAPGRTAPDRARSHRRA